jgi:hypothetical protein
MHNSLTYRDTATAVFKFIKQAREIYWWASPFDVLCSIGLIIWYPKDVGCPQLCVKTAHKPPTTCSICVLQPFHVSQKCQFWFVFSAGWCSVSSKSFSCRKHCSRLVWHV